MTSFQAVFSTTNAVTGQIKIDPVDNISPAEKYNQFIQKVCVGQKCPLYLNYLTGAQNQNHLEGTACAGPKSPLGIATISITKELQGQLGQLVRENARCKPEMT